ncbi:MAG: isoleucine--tRNA ligase [Candidatus Diapherotrites archaeon]|nr:isoleucine--tRNA ligase [Candidatus Diapherotrites archaeon]
MRKSNLENEHSRNMATYEASLIENEIRKFWENNQIPQKLIEVKMDKKKFYLLDGPPYVNAEPHIGHIKTTTLKDIWSKFKLMQGYFVWFQPGFDCHGLPIENKVEKELGIKSKKDIEKLGVDRFIEECRKKALGNEKTWLEIYKKAGAWRGYVEPYMTLKNYYIESAWWTVKQIAEKGMLYLGEKPTYWCPHCETALSGYEVTDSYANVKDPYIYVKFPIEGKKNEYILIFTTTPWTLLSNVAIAVSPDAMYVKAKVGEEYLIISKERAEEVIKELCGLEYEIVEEFPGKELEGLKYLPVMQVPVQQKLREQKNAHKIILSIPVLKSKSYKHAVLENDEKTKEESFDFVNAEEGSGAVHVAPGHGPEDYYIGQHYKLPAISPVDDEGRFTEEAGELKGMFVKDADKTIINKLDAAGLLLYSGQIEHSYPLCWRCKAPLIFRLTKQWFFSVDKIKERMLEENEKVRWLPEFGKERFRNWLKEAIDWCISRQRYWGIPLPIWVCEKCGNTEVIGSVKELREKATEKIPEELDLHKNVVDKIKLKCNRCNSVMHRVPDIVDVWFDSGVAPWASLGYPYKNKDLFEKLWPVDLIDESQDQIRGWFYSLMFTSVAVFNRAPYNAVAMNGWVLDEKGNKMSKSKGNVIWADEALQTLGADVLRLYFCWETPPWKQQNFSFDTAKEIKKALNVLWNSFQFFRTYAEKFELKFENLEVEDAWLLSRINTLVEEVTDSLEKFQFNKAGKALVNFIIEDLSRTYIKKIRDRTWVNAEKKSKQAALSVLYEALLTVTKLLAPITPFISEYMYQELKSIIKKEEGKVGSIFESEWPKAKKERINKSLEKEVECAKEIIKGILAGRHQMGIKLRWPLGKVLVKCSTNIENTKGIIMCLANVRDVAKVSEGEKVSEDYLEVEFKGGKVYVNKHLDESLLEEAMVREVVRAVQNLRKKNAFNVKEYIALTLKAGAKAEKVLKKYSQKIGEEVRAKSVQIGVQKGKITGKVKFMDEEIFISFEKI